MERAAFKQIILHTTITDLCCFRKHQRSSTIVYCCTWRGCSHQAAYQSSIETHVRKHLGRPEPKGTYQNKNINIHIWLPSTLRRDTATIWCRLGMRYIKTVLACPNIFGTWNNTAFHFLITTKKFPKIHKYFLPKFTFNLKWARWRSRPETNRNSINDMTSTVLLLILSVRYKYYFLWPLLISNLTLT